MEIFKGTQKQREEHDEPPPHQLQHHYFSFLPSAPRLHGVFDRTALVYSLNCVRLFATPLTVAHQAPLFMVFPSQQYWTGLPFPSRASFQPRD